MRLKRSGVNLPGLIIGLLLLVVCLFFVLPAALSSNLFFAFGIIGKKPIQTVIYYEGETYIFSPGSEEYDLLVDACYTTLRNQNGYLEWGLSDMRREQARTGGIAVELFYDEPVKLPGARFDMSDPVKLFFPLEIAGYHGEVVFRGGEFEYWGLPLRVDTLDRVRDAVEEIVANQRG